ncbi:MAG TPA: biliverdin-producing heme oxygenase [Chitinophagaceae bacterium]|nr:biliverdin-producing heme oxygenase [Chitinophagaceae bacterium]
MITEHLKQQTRVPHARSLAALYVPKGSAWGGSLIAKMLWSKVQQISLYAFSFFNGYGEQTGTMWATFKERLNHYTTDAAQHMEMINAANETFIKFKHWIRQNESA